MLKIYGAPISVHTRKVIVATLLKRLPHEVIPVVPVIPSSLPPNWRQLSPTGRIPVLADEDFLLPDSAAICAYLDDKHPQASIYPQGLRDRAQALWLEQYAGGTVFCDVVQPLFHELVVNPKIKQIPPDRGRVDEVLGTVVPQVFDYLNAMAGDSYFAGSALSIADLAVVSNLINFKYIGFDIARARYPKLAGLFDRVIRVPEVTAALQGEQPAVQQMGLKSAFLDAVLA